MNGYKLASEIRRLEADAASAVPIIAVTAFMAKDHEQACLKAGFAGFMSKSVEIDSFISLVKHLT